MLGWHHLSCTSYIVKILFVLCDLCQRSRDGSAGLGAATQGVNLRRVRVLVLGMGSLAVGACVAACGPIAFVGLIVPHLVGKWIGGGPRWLVPLSGLAGAGFLPLADGLARAVWVGRDLPVGVFTATLGAPVLLWLLLSRR